MTISWMAKRWCVVEQGEQQDLFVGDPWHAHLVYINMRLDAPLERTLCGDLLPAQPVYRELHRQMLKNLCPQCTDMVHALRGAAKQSKPQTRTVQADTTQQFDLYA